MAGIAVPAALLGGPPTAAAGQAAPTAVRADQQPSCGDPEAKDFPIDTRIHGGPDTYASGGGYGIWYLDLVNTTSESCRALHPVLVLTDQDRQLTSDQIQLAYAERAGTGTGTGAGTEHRVSWETTDRHEQIGVFGSGEAGDDFDGFTVPAGRTVTVRVRMAFTSDTRPGKVVANAAIVQRHRTDTGGRVEQDGRAPASDGDWVGESEDYPFSIVEGDMEGGTDLLLPSEEPFADSETGSGGTDTGTDTGADAESDPETGADPQTESGTETGAGVASDPSRPDPSRPDPSRPDPSAPDPTGGTRTETGKGTRKDTGAGAGAGKATRPSPAPRTDPGSSPGGTGIPRDAAGNPLPELARTGRADGVAALRTGTVAAALLLCGTAALLLARRMRRGRR